MLRILDHSEAEMLSSWLQLLSIFNYVCAVIYHGDVTAFRHRLMTAEEPSYIEDSEALMCIVKEFCLLLPTTLRHVQLAFSANTKQVWCMDKGGILWRYQYPQGNKYELIHSFRINANALNGVDLLFHLCLHIQTGEEDIIIVVIGAVLQCAWHFTEYSFIVHICIIHLRKTGLLRLKSILVKMHKMHWLECKTAELRVANLQVRAGNIPELS